MMVQKQHISKMIGFRVKKIFPLIRCERCVICHAPIWFEFGWEMTLDRSEIGMSDIVETACKRCLGREDRARAYFETKRLRYGY